MAALSRLPAESVPGTWVYGLTHPGSSVRPLTSLPNLQFLQHPLTKVSNVVIPGYLAQPAPLGIGDFGLGAHPYAYNSPHILGSVSFLTPPNATDPGSTGEIEPGGQALGYVGSVDEFGIQLNTILTNVSLQNDSLGVFWTQNVVNWNATGIHFLSDTFNFSNSLAYIPPGTILSGCNNDTAGVQNILNVYGGVFQCVGDTLPLSPAAYPVTLQLYNNASVNGLGQDVLSYGYYVDEAGLGLTFSGVSDQLVFNDTGDAPAAAPPAFSVNGFAPTPLGLPEDSELDLVGDIGGDNAVFSALNATLSLDYSNASVGGFQSVPSAYNFGTDTGETSTGIADYWTPAHVLEANQGPAMLYGLWNAVANVSVPVGHIHLSGSITPSYGFVFVSNTPSVSDPFAAGAPADNFSVLPTTSAGTFSTDLPPTGGAWTDQYYVQAFAPESGEVNGTPITSNVAGYTLDLPSDPGSLNAPLYVSSEAQAAALAFNVSGSSGPPYTFENLVISPNASFDHLNDYLFPSFEIFSAVNVHKVVVQNLTEGQDSPAGNLYFYDFGPSPYVLIGVPSVLGPYPDYTSQIELYWNGFDQVSDESFTGLGGQGGELVLWGDLGTTVSNIVAAFGSGGVFVGNSTDTTVTGAQAGFGSVAVQVLGSTGFSGSALEAVLGSYAAEVYSSTNVSFSEVSVTVQSAGIVAGEDVALFYNTTPYYNLVGARGLYVSDLSVSESDGVEVSVSANINVTDVLTDEAFVAVEFVGVTNGSVVGLNSYGDTFGVFFVATVQSQIVASQFSYDVNPVVLELSASNRIDGGNVFFRSESYAVEILAGEQNYVYGNSFLYNDESGVHFLAETDQAFSFPENYFNATDGGAGNFWSDWHQYTGENLDPYPVAGPQVGLGPIDHHPSAVPFGPVSTVTFAETGLPAKVLSKHAWSVYFEGIAQSVPNATMEFYFPVGSFLALVAGPSGWIAVPGIAHVTTRAPGTTVSISFAKGKSVTLTFREKGLASNQTVVLFVEDAFFETTNGVLKITGLAPGVYSYAVVEPLAGQSIVATEGKTVVGGATGNLTLTKSTRVTLTFSYYTPVEFTESGLPNGDSWSVTIKGHTETAVAPANISFNLTNGTYHFRVHTTAPHYLADPTSGVIRVAGVPESFGIGFGPRHAASFQLETVAGSRGRAEG